MRAASFDADSAPACAQLPSIPSDGYTSASPLRPRPAMLFSDEPVLSLQTSAISKLGNLDAESLAAMWTGQSRRFPEFAPLLTEIRASPVFTKCKTHLENGRRLENLSWRLWYSKTAFGPAGGGVDEHGDSELSDPEGFQTTDDDESEAEAHHSPSHRVAIDSSKPLVESDSTLRRPLHSELAAARPPLLSRTTGSSVERRSIFITGDSLQRMITGLSLDVVPAHKPLPAQIVSPVVVPPATATPAPSQTVLASPLSVPADSTRLATSPRFSATQSPTRTTLHPPKSHHSPSMLRQSSGPPRSGPSRASKPANAKGSTSRLPPLARPVGDDLDRVGSSQSIAIPRNFSTASFEPKSYTKGFTFEEPVPVGSIAPPPTPAPVRAKLGSPPPSAMKSSKKPSGKKIFFISSPNSDSEGESSSPRSTASGRPSTGRGGAQPPDNSLDNHPPPPPRPEVAAPASTEDSWDDEEEDDDDASSGWGSEYSTESDTRRVAKKPERPSALFAKRPSSSANLVESVLQPRPAGLLSQLFHPAFGQEDGAGSSRTRSSVDLSRVTPTRPAMLHSSKSAGLLTEQRRTKSFLRGAPVGTEMESDSEGESATEEGGPEDVESQESTTLVSRPPNAASELARNHRSMMDLAGAYPQTPRTTRRAMLATELSESLRRNLLWERQTRNKVLLHPTAPSAPPSRPPTAQSFVLPPQQPATSARVPQPSPATQSSSSSPLQPIVRRHTTGTGLYLAAQTGKLASGRSSSEEISEEEDEGPVSKDAYGSAFSHHGLHSHGW